MQWICPTLVLVAMYVAVRAQETTEPATGGPYMMHSPRNMTAVQGQRVQFKCDAEAYPDNITYYWYKDGTDVKLLPAYHAKRLTITNGNLLLTGVVKQDMGWYTCKPSNGFGSDEGSAYLNVTYYPRVLEKQMQAQVTWAKGFRQQLDCPVDANPPVTRIVWLKGSTILASTGRFDILLNGTLMVSNVEESDAGSYSCIPYSALGEGTQSRFVQVIVRDPPYFTLRPLPQYQRQVGQAVVLPCAASGTPTPSIAWRKVRGKIDVSGARVTQAGGNLTISSTIKEDHGKYECVASNTIATIIEATELRIVNTTPHAPYNVTVEPGLFSARISWEPAYNGGRPQYYMLWFRPAGSSSWGQLTIPGQGTSFTVHNLDANTNYEFMVLSRNELGNGSFSEKVGAKTLDPDHTPSPRTTVRTTGYQEGSATALPTDAYGSTYIPNVQDSLGPRPTPPRNMTAIRQGDRDILVTWRPPLNPPVPVFWYTVEYLRSDSGAWQRYNGEVLATSGTQTLMEDMEPGAYQIRVVAFGVLAFSQPSNIVSVEIPEGKRLIPDALIGGIVGGVLFLLVAVLLTTMAIIHSKRKDNKSRANANYADVSYGKPEDMNNRPHQTPPKRDRWQQNGGGDIVTSLSNTDSIFFLPRSYDNPVTSGSVRKDPRLFDRDHVIYRPDSGYQYEPHSHSGYRGREPPASFHDAQPPSYDSHRPRSRSQPTQHSPRLPRSPYRSDAELSRLRYPSSERYPTNERLPGYPYSERYPPSERYPSSGHYPSSERYPSDHYPEQRSMRSPRDLSPQQQTLPVQASAPYRGPVPDDYPLHSPQRGYDGPYQSFQSEDDEVFGLGSHPPPTGHASLPRHSSMKPGAQQTYLTGEEEETPAFTLSDISSVLDPPPEQSSQPPWQPPSQDSSRSAPIPSYSADVSGEGRSSLRDKPLARVWPSPKTADDSSDSSGRPLGYTRDQLHDVVDRLRQAPRSRPGDRYLDVSAQGRPGSGRDAGPPPPQYMDPDNAGNPGGPVGWGQGAPPPQHPNYHAHPHHARYPEDSQSSGIGSRNTSQSTSSSLRPRSKPSASISSLLTPHESSRDEDSSHPYLDNTSHRRDTSADENYEFDSLPALESDILDDLHRYSRLAGTGQGTGDVVRELYPKPRRQSQYADAAERFERLREEFQQYRQQQQDPSLSPSSYATHQQPQQQPLYPMDSEML
ncbi:hypothetical protein BaRGS_00016318 [Batillaria attramentaria]|uniref:Uncharacterized protein n=1 Tax=Batillaria attramentaria TaxID=370345 RepID=A0ABD0L005_9CAEN